MPQHDWDDCHAKNHIDGHLLRHFWQDENHLLSTSMRLVGCAEISELHNGHISIMKAGFNGYEGSAKAGFDDSKGAR